MKKVLRMWTQIGVESWPLAIVSGFFIRLICPFGPGGWSALLAGKLSDWVETVYWNETQIRFVARNYLLHLRTKTIFTKEPETIEWLSSFHDEDIFFDIGANVGLYSVLAGFKCKKVLAFEPVLANAEALNKNLYLNNLMSKVTCFPFAISDGHSIDTMRMASLMPGDAQHTFGEDIDYRHQKRLTSVTQGTVGFSVDELIEKYHFPVPHHIKIDVDGLEFKIVEGMIKTIQSKSIKSVLIELNTNLDTDKKIIDIFQSSGYKKYESHWENDGVKNFIFKR